MIKNRYKNLNKLAAYFVCFAFLISFFPIHLAKADQLQNYSLINGNFEDVKDGKPVGWSTHPWSGVDDFSASTEHVHGGKYSLKVVNGTFGKMNYVIGTPITAVPGKTYEATIYTYDTGAASTILLEFLDSSQNRITCKTLKGSVQNDWNKIVIDAAAPENTAYVMLSVNLSADSVGTSYFDDAALVEIQPIITGLVNGDFEDVKDDKPVGWSTHPWSDVDDFSASTEHVHGGKYSLKVVNNTFGKMNYVIGTPMAAASGKTYEATIYTYDTGAASTILLEFLDSSQNRITCKTLKGTVQNNWNKIVIDAAAPNNTAYVMLSVNLSKSSVGTSYFDDAALVEIQPIITGLVNGNFEDVKDDKPVGWSTHLWSDVDDFSASTEHVHGGKYSMKIVNGTIGKMNYVMGTPITAVPGKTYEATIYTYDTGAASTILLEFLDSGQNRITCKPIKGKVKNDWNKIVLDAAAPDNTAYVMLSVNLAKDSVGTSYFDDASLNEKEFGLKNEGFESVDKSKPAAWSFISGFYEASSEKVHSGSYSVKLSSDAQNDSSIRSTQILVDPGKEYAASGYVYDVNSKSDIVLEFWDANNNCISTKSTENSAASSWQKITADATAPTGAIYATIKLNLNKQDNGVSYFDDINCEYIKPEPEKIIHFNIKEQNHPRLFFTAEELQSLRDKANNSNKSVIGVSGNEIWTQIKAQADNYLKENSFTVSYYGGYTVTYPLPPKQPDKMPLPPGYTGDSQYPYWTIMSREIESRLETLSLAYTITGNIDYANKAKEYALAICDWSTWSDPYYNDGGATSLDTAHLTMGVSAAYDMLYNILTDHERSKIENAMDSNGLSKLYNDTETKNEQNISMLKSIALGTGACAVLGKNSNADKYLTRAYNYYKWYFDQKMSSGNNEGLEYTSYVLEYLMRVIDQIARVTGNTDLINHPYINDFIVRWGIYSLSAGNASCINYSDSDSANYFYITMNVINKWLNNGYAGWYVVNAKPTTDSFDRFMYYNPNITVQDPSKLSSSTVLNEIGMAFLRSGWSDNDVMLSLNANNSMMNHNHYDQNSFLISTKNTWIATDPGYQDYSAGPANEFTNWFGHNTIQVDGQGQSNMGGGSLAEKIISPFYDYIIGSAANAYQSPKLNKYDRHIVFINPDYYVMLDDLSADKASTYDWTLYNGASADFEVNGQKVQIGSTVPGNDIYVQKGNAQMRVKFLNDNPLSVLLSDYDGAESYGPYLRVRNATPEKDFKFLSVLKAEPFQSDLYKAVDLSIAETSAQEYKTVTINDLVAVFYRAMQKGDYITYKLPVYSDGDYNLGSSFVKSPLYGKVQVLIDNKPIGDVFDGYDKDVKVASDYNLGKVHLTKGDHYIRFESVGKNDLSGNYFIGVQGISLHKADGTEDNTQSKTDINASLIKNADSMGAKIVSDKSRTTDLVIFKNSNSSKFDLCNVNSNANQVVVSYDTNNKITGYSMSEGNILSYGNQILLKSDKNCSASIGFYNNSGSCKGIINAPGSMNISLYPGSYPEIKIDGQSIGSDKYTYDEKTGLVMLNVLKGQHNIEFTLMNSNVKATLSSVIISVPSAKMNVGDTKMISLAGKMSDGKDADLSKAIVQYKVTNPSIVDIKNGVITAKAAGTTDISAVVTLNGKVIESNKINLTVDNTKQNPSDNDKVKNSGNTKGSGNTSAILPKTGYAVDTYIMLLVGIMLALFGMLIIKVKKIKS